MSTPTRALGDRIRDRRIQNGIPREQLALDTGRSTPTVANWEAGRATPPLSVLIRIADVLGCTVADLRGDQ